MSENNSGGLNDPQRNNMGSIGPGGVNSGSGSSGLSSGYSPGSGSMAQQTNFNSQWSPNTLNSGVQLGVPGFNSINRKNQSLQDINSAIGAANDAASTGSNGSNAQAPISYQTVRKRNKKTGVVEEVQVPVPPTPPLITNPPIPQEKPVPPHLNYPGSIYNGGSPTGPGGMFGGGGNMGGIQAGFPSASGWGGGTNFGTPQRQFGGPAESGGTYTVGENGPEMLQMAPGSQGHVTPMNPADRLGGMNPNMMRDMFQLQMQSMQNPLMGPQQMGQQSGQPPGRQLGGPVAGPSKVLPPGMVDNRTGGPGTPGWTGWGTNPWGYGPTDEPLGPDGQPLPRPQGVMPRPGAGGSTDTPFEPTHQPNGDIIGQDGQVIGQGTPRWAIPPLPGQPPPQPPIQPAPTGGGGYQPPMQPTLPKPPTTAPKFPMGGGGWRNPLQTQAPRPPNRGGTGFGLSGLGQPGVMGALRQRMGGFQGGGGFRMPGR